MSEYEVHVLKTEIKRLQIICDSLEAENAKLRADLKDMAGVLVECVRGQDEIKDSLDIDVDHAMPIVTAYLRELGIEVK